MLLVCPHCGKKHKIDEKRIPAEVTMAKCGSCGKPFKLKAPGVVEELPAFAGERKKTPVTRKIGLLLAKDGSGKATTAVNLAAGLALAGFKVLLVEADLRGRAAGMLGVAPKAGLMELVTGEVNLDEALVKARDKLWLLAGGRPLLGLKRIIDEEESGGENTLAAVVSRVDRQYDYVVALSSAGWDALSVNVLFYVDEIMVPVSLESTTVAGLADFFAVVDSIAKHRRDLAAVHVLPTFKDERLAGVGEALEGLAGKYGDSLCPAVRTDVRLAEAPGYGQTVYEYAPGAPGAQDYRNLVRRIAGDDNLFRV